ncbi:MAG: NADP-dependent phosphogluconate dehydrogenase, partial [Planctomycetes bacterium]|nr:NADP-dependent phosphogluconate dehydrogenase [Planctomycetota bacterium]
MPANSRSQFGIVGLGVMGRSLALNIEEHGRSVAVWNLETEWTDRFVAEHSARRFTGAKTLEEFTDALERPRKILLMIKAGDPVDSMIGRLTTLLEPGDIIIEGGNSWFKDTQRRAAALATDGLRFFGVGVSGGEEGARFGPALMPGGPADAYEQIRPVLESIAARSDSGPCVTYVGPEGSGHFVKMVHNGIEYADMQLIAEAYDILRRAAGLDAAELADVFAEWNRGPLESFLIELTAAIFTVPDDKTGRPLVDVVLDKAGQKGTGRWTVQSALDLGVPIPTISAAIDARLLSAMKDERLAAEGKIGGPKPEPSSAGKSDLIATVHDALHAAKICSYAQGMSLIRSASEAYGWGINLREIARIWKGGCIIRARLLDSIMNAYDRRPDLPSLLLDDELGARVVATQAGLRSAAQAAQGMGIPVPAMSASLAYFDSYRTAELPQNLTQAQRDAFGAHTYERTDSPKEEAIHTDWLKLARKRAETHGEKGEDKEEKDSQRVCPQITQISDRDSELD